MQQVLNLTGRSFWVYRPEITVKGLPIEHIYREIMGVITKARSVKSRSEVLMSRGFNILLIDRLGNAFELGTNKSKRASAHIGEIGSVIHDKSSYSCYHGKQGSTNEFSYYIQIWGKYTWLQKQDNLPLAAFVEVTETEFLKRTIKAKLLRLSENP